MSGVQLSQICKHLVLSVCIESPLIIPICSNWNTQPAYFRFFPLITEHSKFDFPTGWAALLTGLFWQFINLFLGSAFARKYKPLPHSLSPPYPPKMVFSLFFWLLLSFSSFTHVLLPLRPYNWFCPPPHLTFILLPARFSKNVNGSCQWERIWKVLGSTEQDIVWWQRLRLSESYGLLGEESAPLPCPSQRLLVTWSQYFFKPWKALWLVIFNSATLLWPVVFLWLWGPIMFVVPFFFSISPRSSVVTLMTCVQMTVHFTHNEVWIFAATSICLLFFNLLTSL